MALAAQMQQDEYDREEMHARQQREQRERETEQQREQRERETEQQRGLPARRLADVREAAPLASGASSGGIAHPQPALGASTNTPGRTGVTRAKDKAGKAQSKDKKEKGCTVS